MSGFTTSGASTATDPSTLLVSIQVWRQLTIWLGGIGVVALGLAVLPRLRVGGRQLLESELAGAQAQALSGRIRDTVARFWRLYLVLTVAVFVLGTAVLAFEAAFRGPSFDVLDLLFASASTLGNAGFGLGPAGPTGSFAAFGDGSTVAMTLLMWVGRLEILPVLVLLRRSYWRL